MLRNRLPLKRRLLQSVGYLTECSGLLPGELKKSTLIFSADRFFSKCGTLQKSIGTGSSGRASQSVRRQGANYNKAVARGWESKSVEAQQAETSDRSAKHRPPMRVEEAARWREKEGLRLSRQRVLQQLETTQNPRLRKRLDDSLAELEQKLKQ